MANLPTLRFIAIGAAAQGLFAMLSTAANVLVVTPGFGVSEPASLGAMSVIAFSFLMRMPVVAPLMWTDIGPFPGFMACVPYFLNGVFWAVPAWFVWKRLRR
jgi:hypothetical protein